MTFFYNFYSFNGMGYYVHFLNLPYCKFGNFPEGFIFAKLHIYAKFRENKSL